MARDLAHLAARAFNTPLLIHPGKAEVIAAVLAGRIAGLEPPALSHAVPQALDRLDGETRGKKVTDRWGDTVIQERYRYADGVALVTVEGTLVNRGAWIGASMSGLTSYEEVAAQIASAAADPDVRTVVLDIDSPGGEATGAFELASAVRAVAARKPVVALVNGMAASAAYAMASAATRIVVTPSSRVGSIGVVMLHLDRSKQLAQAGVSPTLIFAGDHKVDGNPFGPLPADVRASFQAEIDTLYAAFVATVAAGRPLDAAAVRATQARMYGGADAVAAGLADELGTLDDVVARYGKPAAAARITPRATPQEPSKEPTMTDISKADHDAAVKAAVSRAVADAESTLRARHDADLVAAAAALKDKAAEARSGERARVAGIIGHAAAANRGKLARHLAFETDMPVAAAAAMLENAGQETPAAPAAPAAAAEPVRTHRLDAIVPTPAIAASGGADPAADTLEGGAAEARALLGLGVRK